MVKLVTRFIRPCGPARRREPPSGPEWAHEIKWDGWRLQAHRSGAGVVLYSRPGNDITKRFPGVAEAVAALPGGDLILDGELVAFDDVNRPDFHMLRTRRPTTVAWLFDLMHAGDDDMRDLPWTQRRRRLERLMARNKSDALHLNEIWDDGEVLLRAAAEQGLEGIVSKWRSSPYVSGDTDAWVKVKVSGWTESNRGRFKR